MHTKRNYLVLAGIIAFLGAWSLLLWHFPPQEIVDYLGVENGLIIAFLVALFGGFSSFTSVSYYSVIVILAAGGVNPILLGICTGVGLTFGDSLVYYLGTQSHEVLEGRMLEWSNRVSAWVNDQHERMVQLFVFIYTGLTPLPNDLLTASLGLATYSYRHFLPALLLGNITLAILLAEFSNLDFIKTLLGVQ
ncbi:MAG: VTT domain-containing protein [Candidatus Paceibacterota bacterium]